MLLDFIKPPSQCASFSVAQIENYGDFTSKGVLPHPGEISGRTVVKIQVVVA